MTDKLKHNTKSSKNLARFVKLALAAGGAAMVLSGCAIQRINDDMQETDRTESQVHQHIRTLTNAQDYTRARPALQRMDSLWVDTTPLPMNNRSLGAPQTALDCNITFNPKGSVGIHEFARVVTNVCGVSVNITPDAMQALTSGFKINAEMGTAMQAANQSQGAEGGLPNPNIGGGGGGGGSTTVFASPTGDVVSGIAWVDRPLAGLLDLVTGRLGLGWKYVDDNISIFYIDTQTFTLHVMPGKTRMSTTVKSGANESSSSSSNSSGGSGGGFNSAGSDQSAGVDLELDIMEDITKTLESMMTPGIGRLSVSASTGTVMVTDRPSALKAIRSYIDSENRRMTKQVVLNVKIISVQIDDTDSMGLNWSAVYNKLGHYGIGLTSNSAVGSAIASTQGSVAILNSDSRWDTTKMFFEALSEQGRTRLVSSPSVVTTNLRPVPVLIGKQKSYLASVVNSISEGVVTSELTPGTVTTGLNMTLLPYMLDGPDMLLQYSINLSALLGIERVESGDNAIQLPDMDNRIFSQHVKMRSGETLVLSGFDQTESTSGKQGTGDSSFWLLGGGGARQKNRDVMVMLITPVISD